MGDFRFSRRFMLRAMTGGLALAAGISSSAAGEARIKALIEEARTLPMLAQRIVFISRAFLGAPYRAYTLIGGPHRREQFVVRDDGFDCVTFCETVLAAARAREADEFDAALRRIRYHMGRVEWRERNHYFSDWCEFNIANGTCWPVMLPNAVPIKKLLDSMPGLEPRHMSLIAIPTESLLSHRDRIASGDIIGFLSQRPGLDYFHTGFVIVTSDGELWLRHAAKSRRHVLDQRLPQFLANNRVHYVTLLRPQEPWNDTTII